MNNAKKEKKRETSKEKNHSKAQAKITLFPLDVRRKE